SAPFSSSAFLFFITLAAITAVPTRCLAQLTGPASDTLTNDLNSSASHADEGLGSLRHISAATPPLVSLVDVAPGLLPFFNNAPVFGLPGSVEGNFWHRTQLLGGLDGRRMDLANHGLFIDVYSTGYYQDVTSGGLKTGNAYVQNTQASINLDTGRAGLWSAGLFHFTVQSRYRSSPENTFTVGSFVPQYTGLVEPGALLSDDTLPSEYFLLQALTKKVSVILG